MRKEDVVVLQVFHTHIDADLARSALEAAGIEATLAADDAGGLEPQLDATRGVALFVHVKDVEQARDILNQPARPVANPER